MTANDEMLDHMWARAEKRSHKDSPKAPNLNKAKAAAEMGDHVTSPTLKRQAVVDVERAEEAANGMTQARMQLEKETERGMHKPAVAGHKDHNHSN